MKPLGITANLQMINPSKLEDLIWQAVEEAQDMNYTVDQFRAECAKAWDYYRDEQRKRDNKDWQR